LSFEVISGGMITGERIGAIGEVASYISWAYKDVEKATNVKFGTDFLDKTLKNGKAIFTSIPTAIALSVFKDLKPENSIEFAAELQKAIYFDGIEPENFNAYGKIAAKFGEDSEAFIAKMKDAFYQKKIEEDFKLSSAFGVTGFPSVFLEVDETYYKIASGYVPFSVLENNFLSVKNRKE